MKRQIVCFAIPSLEVGMARLNNPPLRIRPLAIANIRTPERRFENYPIRRLPKAFMLGCLWTGRDATGPR